MLASLLLTSALCAPAVQDCDGDPSLRLSVDPPIVTLGDEVTIRMEGPANQRALLLLSDGQGPVDSSYGRICLDLPPLFSRGFRLDDQGLFELTFTVPADCRLDDATFYLQFLVCDPFRGVSNQASIEFEAAGLGDLRYGDCVDEDLRGLSTREVLAIGELILSGMFGQCDGVGSCKDEDVYDASGDGVPDVSLIDVHEALDILNNAFVDCSSDTSGCFENAADCGYCTFTPGGYSQDCQGGNVGCIRDAWFDTLFPAGLVAGDPDGPDADGEYALLVTSSDAMRITVIGATGNPATLSGDETDPVVTSAGRFAAQILAAKFNIALDDAGALD